MEIKNLESFSIKDCKEINEKFIQDYIFNNPSVLKLGDLRPIKREKIQPSGGRLDLLLADDTTRYEVEIQLGKTDESHIIRTIEYWDSERRRYQQYDHCAVLVAEQITRRFLNVISLFNGVIPLVAIQMSAHRIGNEVYLYFTKIIDRVIPGDEEDDQYEVADRTYWETKSTNKIMGEIDKIFTDLGEMVEGYSLKYNKPYIGISFEGIPKNFIEFYPKKSFLTIRCRAEYDETIIQEGIEEGIDISYVERYKRYEIKLLSFDEFKKHEEFIKKIIKDSKQYFGL